MTIRPRIARVLLWRGNAPTFTGAFALSLFTRFALGWQPSGVLLAGLIAGALIAACIAWSSKHTNQIEGLLAQLTRANHRLNGEIEERLRVEKELAAARDEALELTRLKSQFLANMSHEIRTPMNGIMGMTHLILDTPLNDEQRECAEAVLACGDTLMSMIDDILDFTKVEAHTLELRSSEFETRPVLDGVLDLMQAPAMAKHLRLTGQIANDLPPVVIGDAARLRQMLIILIGNAVKFTERGEVTVTAKVFECAEKSVALRISVQDTGVGIRAVDRERLFQSFHQTDGSHTRRYRGAGLGLAICKALAEMMGGDVEVESQIGSGSTFHLTVRFETPAADHAEGLIGLSRWTGESVTPERTTVVH